MKNSLKHAPFEYKISRHIQDITKHTNTLVKFDGDSKSDIDFSSNDSLDHKSQISQFPCLWTD